MGADTSTSGKGSITAAGLYEKPKGRRTRWARGHPRGNCYGMWGGEGAASHPHMLRSVAEGALQRLSEGVGRSLMACKPVGHERMVSLMKTCQEAS